jgi:hypothetical protein
MKYKLFLTFVILIIILNVMSLIADIMARDIFMTFFMIICLCVNLFFTLPTSIRLVKN